MFASRDETFKILFIYSLSLSLRSIFIIKFHFNLKKTLIMKDLEQIPKSLSDFNSNVEKVKSVNKETIQQIKQGLEEYKALTHGNRFRVPYKVAKFLIICGAGYMVF